MKGKTGVLIVIALVVLGALIWWSSATQKPANKTGPTNEAPAEQTDENAGVDDTTATSPSNEGGNATGTKGATANEGTQNQEGQEGGAETNNLPPAVFNTSGKIKDVGSDYLIVSSDGSHMTKVPSDGTVEVRVNIDASTNILDSENNPIKLSELSAGQQVSIEAASNIKNKKEFTGSNIKLQ